MDLHENHKSVGLKCSSGTRNQTMRLGPRSLHVSKPLTPTTVGEQPGESSTGQSQTPKGKILPLCKETFLYSLKRSLHHASGSFTSTCPCLPQELCLGCLLQVTLAKLGIKRMGSRETHPRRAAGEVKLRTPRGLRKGRTEEPRPHSANRLHSAAAGPPTQLCDFKLHVYPHGFLFLPHIF